MRSMICGAASDQDVPATGTSATSFLAVLSGWPLGRLMRRPEDYYDTRSGEAGRDR